MGGDKAYIAPGPRLRLGPGKGKEIEFCKIPGKQKDGHIGANDLKKVIKKFGRVNSKTVFGKMTKKLK